MITDGPIYFIDHGNILFFQFVDESQTGWNTMWQSNKRPRKAEGMFERVKQTSNLFLIFIANKIVEELRYSIATTLSAQYYCLD